MIQSRALAAAALLLAGLAAPASAASMTPQEEAAFRQNCTGDYMRLCAMYDPDSPQVEQCFAAKAKSKELSAGCAATITAYSKANPGKKR